ncbi:hypothetical protein PInf_000399 [Phytophthora infestans]|nr:hypothetical protein PInf_000399 [Phytophthora infestans]
MATEMTTTEETENDGDSDERGRETLAREDWLNAVATLCHLAVRWRGHGSSKQTTETSEETETFVEGTTTEMATEMTTTEKRKTTETVTSEDVRALAREDVSGDVTRRVAERGGYAVSSGCTTGAGTGLSKPTTETSEETETFCRGYHYGNGHRDDHDGGNGNDGDSDERGRESLGTRRLTSEDVRALAREDVSGDVTRRVAERGGYAVSSGCTTGAGTGSSKQTTETSEETETFCRGYHYENGHRDDHDEETENDGDSDERGRESLGTRRRDPQCG